jgi:hypothetical protein
MLEDKKLLARFWALRPPPGPGNIALASHVELPEHIHANTFHCRTVHPTPLRPNSQMLHKRMLPKPMRPLRRIAYCNALAAN